MSTLIDFKSLHLSLHQAISGYEAGSIPHALLIHGPAGVGKKTLAKILCMRLMCCAQDALKPCGRCDQCRRVEMGAHSNVLSPSRTAGSRSIKIEDLRKIIEMLGRHGLESGARAVVIADADEMTPQAQNALLKSLEEPLESTYFLLTASGDRGILPTIRSRCSVLYIPPRDSDSIMQVLYTNGNSGRRAQKLLDACDGSPGRALQMEKDSHFWDTAALVEETFLYISKPVQLPSFSGKLRNVKEDADLIFSILENRVSRAMQADEGGQSSRKFSRLAQDIMIARKYRASNVAWQSIADRLLFQFMEEQPCQWS